MALWIDRLAEAPRRLDGTVVWVALHAGADAWSLPPATPDDLADAARARREGGAPRVLRRRMLRALAARVFDLHPDRVRFVRDVRGAPGLEGLPAHLSASGSSGVSAVALAPHPVGVDVEARSEPGDLRGWTLLEATRKAHGRGLDAAPVLPGVSEHREKPGYVAALVELPRQDRNEVATRHLAPATAAVQIGDVGPGRRGL